MDVGCILDLSGSIVCTIQDNAEKKSATFFISVKKTSDAQSSMMEHLQWVPLTNTMYIILMVDICLCIFDIQTVIQKHTPYVKQVAPMLCTFPPQHSRSGWYSLEFESQNLCMDNVSFSLSSNYIYFCAIKEYFNYRTVKSD